MRIPQLEAGGAICFEEDDTRDDRFTFNAPTPPKKIPRD